MAEKKTKKIKKIKKTEAALKHVQGVRIYHQGEQWFGTMSCSNQKYINSKDDLHVTSVTGNSPEEIIQKLGL